MRNYLRTSARRLSVGGFWAAVLLVLPNCSLDTTGTAAPQNFSRGPGPWTSAVSCDIEKASGRRCPAPGELELGIRLSEAAVALAEGRTAPFGLDDSPAARALCGGDPQVVEFEGPFPQGLPVCLNCLQIGGTFADANAACQIRCLDFYGATLADRSFRPAIPPSPDVLAFCLANARVSTNAPVSSCFGGACTDAGIPLPDFDDPRDVPEPVIWRDFIGTADGGAEGNDLTRTAAATGEYDAGAASTQWITRGDAYVEFTVESAAHSHFLGVTEVPAGCTAPDDCPDTGPSYLTMGFAVMLHSDGRYYIAEGGAGVPGPNFNESWGDYTAGDRFRVTLRDNADGTATVSYHRVVGACVPGIPCNLQLIYTHGGAPPSYPFRIDSSIREVNGTLRDVRVVRIR